METLTNIAELIIICWITILASVFVFAIVIDNKICELQIDIKEIKRSIDK